MHHAPLSVMRTTHYWWRSRLHFGIFHISVNTSLNHVTTSKQVLAVGYSNVSSRRCNYIGLIDWIQPTLQSSLYLSMKSVMIRQYSGHWTAHWVVVISTFTRENMLAKPNHTTPNQTNTTQTVDKGIVNEPLYDWKQVSTYCLQCCLMAVSVIVYTFSAHYCSVNSSFHTRVASIEMFHDFEKKANQNDY